MSKNLSPVILFVYNRPEHTERTLTALSNNHLASESELFVFSDGPKLPIDVVKVDEVRAIIRNKVGFKKIHITERAENLGLADSIIAGVNQIIEQYGKVIVLEDDIITSPFFLKFMNDALDLYSDEEKVMHISGYMFPVSGNLPDFFFYRCTSCWGWATWKRAWVHFNKDAGMLLQKIEPEKTGFNIEGSYDYFGHLEANHTGILKTWGVKWYASVFLKQGLALHPKLSYTNNIGHDGSGENCGNSEQFEAVVSASDVELKKICIEESVVALRAIRNYYTVKVPLKARLIGKIKKMLPNRLKHFIKISLNRKMHWWRLNLFILKRRERFKEGSTKILGHRFYYTDAASFVSAFQEIFIHEKFKFNTTARNPYILDCGSNVGLSIIYYKTIFPGARIVGFEPDPKVFEILKSNLTSFNIHDVTLYNKALSEKDGTTQFVQDGADGGHISESIVGVKSSSTIVETMRLGPLLTETVDFLKMDIEGAECAVIADISDKLGLVNKIFIEYHSVKKNSSDLSALLELLTENFEEMFICSDGSLKTNQPFISINKVSGLQFMLDIFAYKKI